MSIHPIMFQGIYIHQAFIPTRHLICAEMKKERKKAKYIHELHFYKLHCNTAPQN